MLFLGICFGEFAIFIFVGETACWACLLGTSGLIINVNNRREHFIYRVEVWFNER